MRFGLLGEHLKHSYSPQIHQKLHGMDYGLYEVSPEELEGFLKTTELDGINVTIPYKQKAMPFCVRISDTAGRIGCVNTLVRRPDGWHGYNTDYDGFRGMLKEGGIDPAGKKVLVLGNGGASLTARTALKDLGAAEIVIMSRSAGASESREVRIDSYGRLGCHADAEIIINTTPAGMYPGNGEKLLDLEDFPKCTGVADVIYNPARTALLLQAEALGIPHTGGLGMLVSQARRSAELWLNRQIADRKAAEIFTEMEREMQNIVLIGMPGCGKTEIGRALQARTGRRFMDTDEMIEELTGRTVSDIITEDGEKAFRAWETKAVSEAGKESGCIIATGGGCVTSEGNYPLLHQNGRIVWIRRELGLLQTDGRPLSRAEGPEELYKKRRPLYARFADIIVDNDTTVEEAAERILKLL